LRENGIQFETETLSQCPILELYFVSVNKIPGVLGNLNYHPVFSPMRTGGNQSDSIADLEPRSSPRIHVWYGSKHMTKAADLDNRNSWRVGGGTNGFGVSLYSFGRALGRIDGPAVLT